LAQYSDEFPPIYDHYCAGAGSQSDLAIDTSVFFGLDREIYNGPYPFTADSEKYILRMCKADVSIDMYLSHDMCIGESRPGSGHMCTCYQGMCNSVTLQNINSALLLSLVVAAFTQS